MIRKQGLPIGLIGNDNSNFKRVAVKCGDLKILKLSSPLVSTRHEFMVFGRLKHWSLGPDANPHANPHANRSDPNLKMA